MRGRVIALLKKKQSVITPRLGQRVASDRDLTLQQGQQDSEIQMKP